MSKIKHNLLYPWDGSDTDRPVITIVTPNHPGHKNDYVLFLKGFKMTDSVRAYIKKHAIAAYKTCSLKIPSEGPFVIKSVTIAREYVLPRQAAEILSEKIENHEI